MNPARTFAAVALGCLAARGADLRIGLVGLDTSRVGVYAALLNDPAAKEHVAGARVVGVVKGADTDLEGGGARLRRFTQDVESRFHLAIFDSVAALCRSVDAVIITEVDGRAHLEQARTVIAARKPLFIDKPVAASLRDVVAIYRLAQEQNVPCFSASSLRYRYADIPGLTPDQVGDVRGAVSVGPAHLEPHHPDLFWYGIHPLEALYAVLGPGCISVQRTSTADIDAVTGVWPGGRVGTLEGLRNVKYPYRMMVFGTRQFTELKAGGSHAGLLREVLRFFQTGIPPIAPGLTLEIYAFMEAADESKREGGRSVPIDQVLRRSGWSESMSNPHGDLVFREDFIGPLRTTTDYRVGRAEKLWCAEIGKWEIADGALQGQQIKGRHSAIDYFYLPFQDAVIQFDAQVNGCNRCIFRINDFIPGRTVGEHVCRVTLSRDGLVAQKDDHDHAGPDTAVSFGMIHRPFKPGEWKTVRIEIRGDRMAVTMDGETVTGRHPLIAAPKDNIGFGVTGSSARFRNLRVWKVAN